MTERNFSTKTVICILIIAAALVALSSMPNLYAIGKAEKIYETNQWPDEYDYAFGYQLYTAWFSLGLQLLSSLVLIFLSTKRWSRTAVVFLATLQFLIVLKLMRFECLLLRVCSDFLEGVCWEYLARMGLGYWLLLSASGLMLVCSVLNFFVKQQKEGNPELLDGNV